MASHPASDCCMVVKAIHEGTPAGKVQEINGYSTYVAEPSHGKGNSTAILLLTDVLGHKFHNLQLIADQYAANGFYTVVPDLFEGDPVSVDRGPDFNLQAWLEKHPFSKAYGPADTLYDYLKQEKGYKTVAGIGYCYGAKLVVNYMASGSRQLDIGAINHPSFVTIEEVSAIRKPLIILAAETDHIFPEELRHQTEAKLKEMKATYTLQLFSGVEHGFSVRGNIDQPHEKYAKEGAFLQTVNFFKFYLGIPSKM